LTAAQYFHKQADSNQQIFHMDGGMMDLKNYLND